MQRDLETILVFIDGTTCNTRQRHHLMGTPEFHARDAVIKDTPVPGSVACLHELAQRYTLVYLGARPETALPQTQEWLDAMGFPAGPVHLAPAQEERLELVRRLAREHTFVAGIGDRWDDNEIHLEIGCTSIILQEFAGDWDQVRRRLLRSSTP